jgi:hypothetical protein
LIQNYLSSNSHYSDLRISFKIKELLRGLKETLLKKTLSKLKITIFYQKCILKIKIKFEIKLSQMKKSSPHSIKRLIIFLIFSILKEINSKNLF